MMSSGSLVENDKIDSCRYLFKHLIVELAIACYDACSDEQYRFERKTDGPRQLSAAMVLPLTFARWYVLSGGDAFRFRLPGES